MNFFIENPRVEDLLKWISDSFDRNLGRKINENGLFIYHYLYKGRLIPVIFTTNIENTQFMEVWFNASELPWASSKDLAVNVSKELKKTTRYDTHDCFYEYFEGQTTIVEEWL